MSQIETLQIVTPSRINDDDECKNVTTKTLAFLVEWNAMKWKRKKEKKKKQQIFSNCIHNVSAMDGMEGEGKQSNATERQMYQRAPVRSSSGVYYVPVLTLQPLHI